MEIDQLILNIIQIVYYTILFIYASLQWRKDKAERKFQGNLTILKNSLETFNQIYSKHLDFFCKDIKSKHVFNQIFKRLNVIFVFCLRKHKFDRELEEELLTFLNEFCVYQLNIDEIELKETLSRLEASFAKYLIKNESRIK